MENLGSQREETQMSRQQDSRPPIREVIKARMEERGHTVKDAERVMEMTPKTLYRIVRGQVLQPHRAKEERIADCLGIPQQAVHAWFSRDAQRVRGDGHKQVDLANVTGPTLTWYGVIDAADPEPSCKKCTRQAECRQAADRGLPLPCERLLARELVPEDALFRESSL
jgi:lambda repressor-like predicted transcriptional regulator